jgi:hypothetical protein
MVLSGVHRVTDLEVKECFVTIAYNVTITSLPPRESNGVAKISGTLWWEVQRNKAAIHVCFFRFKRNKDHSVDL